MNKKLQKITHAQLASLLASKTGAMPIGILSRTDSKALKTGNPFGETYKIARGAVWTGVKYETQVNSEAVEQGLSPSFEAGPLPKGREWVLPNKVLRNQKTGEFMLRTQSRPKQRAMRSFKVLRFETGDGREIAKELLAPFLPAPSVSKKQEAIGLEGSDKQIAPRDYNFSSLLEVRIAGKRYAVDHSA